MDLARSDGDQGIALFRSGLSAELVEQVASRAEDFYRALDCAGKRRLPAAAILPPRERFVPTASSVTILATIDLAQLHRLYESLPFEVHRWITDALHDSPACDLDQAWLRRQYAPTRYPSLHAPHGWHQDGALGFSFGSVSHSAAEPAVLPMVTCWTALNRCGLDAPGLEFVRCRFDHLLQPAELTDSSVRARFELSGFWCPQLEPGDVLLFRGDILHRTHVTPSMSGDRTSIELRLFSSERPPARLSGDRFVRLDGLSEESVA